MKSDTYMKDSGELEIPNFPVDHRIFLQLNWCYECMYIAQHHPQCTFRQYYDCLWHIQQPLALGSILKYSAINKLSEHVIELY